MLARLNKISCYLRILPNKSIFLTCLLLSSIAYSENINFSKDHAQFTSLLRGVSIDVVAPASGYNERIMSILRKIKEVDLNIPDECFTNKLALHSTTDDLRFQCLRNALFNDKSKVVWALRGGYGSAKLIPYLQRLTELPGREKFFIGFSDITALHIFLTQEWGWRVIHANCIGEIINPEKDRDNFIKVAQIISGTIRNITMPGLVPFNKKAKESNTIVGKLTGGNLTIIQTSIGTNWQLNATEKILFLEDINLVPYQLDRSLLHLKQAGLLKGVKAIVFGYYAPENQELVKTIKTFAANLDIPVFKTNRFGHGRINDPIIYNTDTKILSEHDGKFKMVMSV